jgi:hypothetical protein
MTGESTMQKVKDVLHLNKGHGHDSTSTHTSSVPGTTTTNTHAEGTHGPHDTKAANFADPRVDSDVDGSHRTAEGTRGPHSTQAANFADPRVDSNQGGTYGHGEGTHGPHSSKIANAVDPRVDSDRDGNRIPNSTSSGYGTQNSSTLGSSTHTGGTSAGNHLGGTGFSGGLSNSTNAGPHDSNLANKVDPRVDSDLDGRGNQHGHSTGGILGASGSHATPGSGTAQNTAGPHNSDMLNKVDPRVDSDRDNSATIGGSRY